MSTVQETLRRFGVTRCYKGFDYMAFALNLSMQNEDCLTAMTREIYLPIAHRFGVNWMAAERNIRTITARAWQVNPQLLQEMAGYPLNDTPTNSEFLEILTHYLTTQKEEPDR